MVDLNLIGPPLKVLAKYTRKCLEATVDPWLWDWRARKRGEAELTAAESEIDVFNAMVEAQTEAASSFLNRIPSTSETTEWKSEIKSNLVGSQVQKRINNQVSIVRSAASILKDTEVEDHDPDPDWTANYAQHAQDVSSEELQSLWAKVLAGEIQNPGQTSLRTLGVLKNMSQQEAALFQEMSDYVINGGFLFSRRGFSSPSPSPGTTLTYEKMSRMQECGLVTAALNTSLELSPEDSPFYHTYHSVSLRIEKNANSIGMIQFPMVMLTNAGEELYQIMNPKIKMAYLKELAKFLIEKNYHLYLLEGHNLRPDGFMDFTHKTLISP